jgi:hydrogenase maturation factor
MQEIKNNKIEITNEFYKKLKTKYKLTKNQANYYINQQISDFGQYVIGHMVALELYKIYKQDKKEALKILDKIIKNNTKDTLVNLSEYFNIKESLNNNLTEEYKKINNQFVKKIERG